MVKSSFYHLKLLSKIKSTTSFTNFALSVLRLDSFNARSADVNQTPLAGLQLFQKAAACHHTHSVFLLLAPYPFWN